MAHPSSAEEEGEDLALDVYFQLGGNSLHLHDEGAGVHCRRSAGQWLRRRGLRAEFFLCAQICHTGWDYISQSPIDRFTPAAVREDIDADLELLATKHLDFVYLDDNPTAPLEPLIEALAHEIRRGRIRAFGFRNWTGERIAAAQSHTSRGALPGPAAVVTTELALAHAASPLWPEYVPFDHKLRRSVADWGLAVLAHAADINLGQCLYENGDATTRYRRHWLERWDHPSNQQPVSRVRRFASSRETTPRAINIAWLLNQPFSCIAIVPLPVFRTSVRREYEDASQLILSQPDQGLLKHGALLET